MTKIGDTVELIRCTDPYTKLTPGLRGKVRLVDDVGTVHVNWENGSNLGLCPGEDQWKVVTKSSPTT